MNRKKRSHLTNPIGLSSFARLRLRAALFLSGASVMVLEILGTRIIGPHFGVGLFVWTSLITVTMVALAAGYWLGGKLADRHPSLLMFSGVLLAAAGFIALIPQLRGPVLDAGWTFGLRSGSLFAAAALFFVPLMLLGMVSPFAVRLESDGVEQAGRSAGRLYAISTGGSVVGAVLTGFTLVPMFRVPVILSMLSATLVLAAMLGAGSIRRKRVIAVASVIIIGGLVLAWPKTRPPELLDVRSYDGSDIRVVAHAGNRYLFVDQAIQSSFTAEGQAREKYIYFLASRLILARPEAKSAALVGLGGGGLVPILMESGISMECVDLSPEVIELARTRFGFNLPASQVHAMDGRVFLKQHPGRFDLVILDVFTGDRIAYPLISLEGLRTAKAALSDGGMLALNTLGINLEQGRPNRVGSAIYKTLRQSFRHVLAVPASDNLLFFASDEPIEPQKSSVRFAVFDGLRHFTWLEVPPTRWPDAPILTDDWNPVDTLDAAEIEAIRLTRRMSFPEGVREALAWE